MSRRSGNFVASVALLSITLMASSCSDSAAPPKPSRLALVTAPSASAGARLPLEIQPVVQTVDVNGQAVAASTTVTAAVIAGPGKVMAGPTATTDADGRARFSGLTIAAINGQLGQLTLQFSAPGLEAVSASLELQCGMSTLSIPGTVNGSLSTGDCMHGSPSLYQERFSITTTQALTPVQLTLQPEFPPSLAIVGPNDPNELVGYTGPNSVTTISFKALLPPGRTLVVVLPAYNNLLGNYTLTTEAAGEDITCDTDVPVLTAPINSAQHLNPGDCANGSYLEDRALFTLPINGTVSVRMESSDFDPRLDLLDATTHASLTSATGTGSASLTFTATARRAYYLVLSSSAAGASGQYNFSFNATYPSNGAASTDLVLPLVGQRMSLPSRVRR